MHPVKDLRVKSTDTEGGTPVPVMMSEMARLWPVKEDVASEYGAFSAAELKKALREVAVVVVGGDYQKLPFHYRRWTSNDKFAHAIAIKFLLEDGRTRMYDPLGGGPTREPYDGEWIPFDAIFDGKEGFGWSAIDGRYYAGVVQNKNEAPMEKMYLDPDRPVTRVMRTRDGTLVYEQPDKASKRIKIYWNADKVRWLYGSAGMGWRITVFKNETGDWVKGYLDVEDIVYVGDAPATPVTPCPPCEDVEPYKTTIASQKEEMDVMNADILDLQNAVEQALDILKSV
jgi:hypothetical protein